MKFKNEVIVGLMVLIGIVVILIGAFWLSGKPWGTPQQDLVGIFGDVGELKEGNPVVYRGVGIGRVAEIALAPRGNGVLVTMEVSAEVPFPRDAAVVLAPASLFGDWQAEIVAQSLTPTLEFTTADIPDVLPGATLPDISELTGVASRIANDLETLSERVELAFTEETAIKLRETVENVQEISEQLTGFVGKQTQTFDAISQNALASSRNIEQATAAVERVAGGVEGDVQSILANARSASENIARLSTQLENATGGIPAVVARADSTLITVAAVANSVNSVLSELGPELGPTLVEARQSLATVNALVTRVQQGEGSIGRLLEDPALYEEMQRALSNLNRVMADLQDNPSRYLRGVVKVF